MPLLHVHLEYQAERLEPDMHIHCVQQSLHNTDRYGQLVWLFIMLSRADLSSVLALDRHKCCRVKYVPERHKTMSES